MIVLVKENGRRIDARRGSEWNDDGRRVRTGLRRREEGLADSKDERLVWVADWW